RVGRKRRSSWSCRDLRLDELSAAAAAGRGTSYWLRKGYFAGFFLFFASARRSVFFRRAARFLTLSLPWLCPIIPNTLCRLHQTSNIKSVRGRIRRGEHQKFFGDTHPPVARLVTSKFNEDRKQFVGGSTLTFPAPVPSCFAASR